MDHLGALKLAPPTVAHTSAPKEPPRRQPSLFSMRNSLADVKGSGSHHTIVSLQLPVLSHMIDETGRLRCAELLKSMDICACMSAERHSNANSVTLSMDDVNFSDARVTTGDVVVIRSRVNRVWTTSMEVGLRVEVEAPETGETRHVCSSYFVFVALDKDGCKHAVPPLIPVSEREKIRYALAGDRRQIRIDRVQIIDKAAAERARMSISATSAQALGEHGRELAATLSMVPSHGSLGSMGSQAGRREEEDKNVITQMVLPQHANHYGGTFGGQIMAWSHEAAQVAAARHARCRVVTVSVDDVHFLAGSKVGTRVVLKASVNRVFSRSMEAGVRVEGHSLDGSVVLLTRAYFTLVAVDPAPSSAAAAAAVAVAIAETPAVKAAKPKSLLGGRSKSPPRRSATDPPPKLVTKASMAVRQVAAASEDEQRRYAKAAGRRRVRLERLALRQSNHLAWQFSPDTDPRAMVLENLVALDRAARAGEDVEWTQTESREGVTVWTKQDASGVTIKTEYEFAAAFDAVVDAVTQVGVRKAWDQQVVAHDVRHAFAGLSADVVWLAVDTRALDPKAKPTDFALLRSWKRDGDTYVIASHSVVHASVPGEKAYVRAEVASSGFFLQDVLDGTVRVVYLLQLNPQGTSIVAGELLGTSRIAVARMHALKAYCQEASKGKPSSTAPSNKECAVM